MRNGPLNPRIFYRELSEADSEELQTKCMVIFGFDASLFESISMANEKSKTVAECNLFKIHNNCRHEIFVLFAHFD